MKELIERALQRELNLRRELRPHAQLGVPPDAPPRTVVEAFTRLRHHYDPVTYVEYGEVALAAAQAIVQLLREAHDQLCDPARRAELQTLEPGPRSDETVRALAMLRGAIARRIALAREHRDAGRGPEAIRAYEAVLMLDRRNEEARQALVELRSGAMRRGGRRLSRLFSRLLGGTASPRASRPDDNGAHAHDATHAHVDAASVDDAAHDETAHDETAHDETAHDETAHDETAPDEAAPDEAAHDATHAHVDAGAVDDAAHDETTHDEAAHDEAAHDGGVVPLG